MERSQHKNRATAWNMLRARLYEQEIERREAEANAINATKSEIGWGHQIRSYVLQPYQMVKDLRTGDVSAIAGRSARRRSRRLHGGLAGATRSRRRPGQGRGRGLNTPAYSQPVFASDGEAIQTKAACSVLTSRCKLSRPEPQRLNFGFGAWIASLRSQ